MMCCICGWRGAGLRRISVQIKEGHREPAPWDNAVTALSGWSREMPGKIEQQNLRVCEDCALQAAKAWAP